MCFDRARTSLRPGHATTVRRRHRLLLLAVLHRNRAGHREKSLSFDWLPLIGRGRGESERFRERERKTAVFEWKYAFRGVVRSERGAATGSPRPCEKPLSSHGCTPEKATAPEAGLLQRKRVRFHGSGGVNVTGFEMTQENWGNPCLGSGLQPVDFIGWRVLARDRPEPGDEG